MNDQDKGYEGWAILELMGHVRLAGRVTEESHFGVALGRIDIPTAAGDGYTTQYFGGASIYRLTPTTEEIARSVAVHSQPRPVQSWELPARTAITAEQATPDAPEYGRDEWDEEG